MNLSLNQIYYLKSHWNIDDQIVFHRRVANFVYFVNLNQEPAVLRLTEAKHRSQDEILSELDWIEYLAKNGMSVARPIPTVNNSLVIELPGSEKFFAVLFKKAKGEFLPQEQDIPDELIKNWGRFIGRMHLLSKNYHPTAGIISRQQWTNDESLAMALRSLDQSDEIAYTRMNQLLEWMKSLPKNINEYGLIHTDLHQGNFFVEHGLITAFDFDDSCYQWFSYDLIAPLNSMSKKISEGVQSDEKSKILDTFLQGYNKENKLDPIWIDRLEIFDKYRAVLVYHWIKTFTKESVLDAKGLEWASQKAPKLLKVLSEPLKLF